MNIIPQSFYDAPTIQVAHDLLGKRLIRKFNGHILAGIIVETEAYCGQHDPASHSYKGPTNRNKALFGPVGYSYIYFIYGNHFCLNIVAKEKGMASGGVLIRGLIPIDGIPQMMHERHTQKVSNLTNGPGKIGQALNLRLSDNHIDVTQEGPLYITEGIVMNPNDIIATPRIGISKAQENLWRFIVKKEAQDQIVQSYALLK